MQRGLLYKMKWVYAVIVVLIVVLIIWRVIKSIFFGQPTCGTRTEPKKAKDRRK